MYRWVESLSVRFGRRTATEETNNDRIRGGRQPVEDEVVLRRQELS